ncbi:MAG: zinc-ribbon domain-containing protein [Methanomicrobiales archaeon]|nr:zinc-ribbon domain-containing protein [Methanomicrobiales archaeon]
MKCPHCGMNIRDNITECGYCGGKIAQRPERAPAGGMRTAGSGADMSSRGMQSTRAPAADPDGGGEDGEEGGVSAYLQPGEQVLIGSLSVSVKKFFFHAYLTNQRVFLIDTQEKKLKVTAKDVARDTIVGSIVEFSENSDPVLVLSIRSPDEEIKTMKIVFAQNGMDRSAEIDEWIALLHDEETPKKPAKRPAPQPARPAVDEEEPEEFRPPPKPVQKPGLHPARKPTKELEKQPPVKRLLSMYKVEDEEPAVEPEPEYVPPAPARKPQVRQVPEPVRKPVITPEYDHEDSPSYEAEAQPVRKPEVQSAMKVAMKSAMRPLQQQHTRPPVRRAVSEHEDDVPAPSRRPVVHEPPREKPVAEEEPAATKPQFCHNCGKKLPHAANFCPGCGTKLSQSRTLPQNRHATTVPDRRATRTVPPVHDHKTNNDEEFDDDQGGEVPVPAKPPIKKAPKGSEMTILHKFLRR